MHYVIFLPVTFKEEISEKNINLICKKDKILVTADMIFWAFLFLL
jgi:hypothetical protein